MEETELYGGRNFANREKKTKNKGINRQKKGRNGGATISGFCWGQACSEGSPVRYGTVPRTHVGWVDRPVGAKRQRETSGTIIITVARHRPSLADYGVDPEDRLLAEQRTKDGVIEFGHGMISRGNGVRSLKHTVYSTLYGVYFTLTPAVVYLLTY